MRRRKKITVATKLITGILLTAWILASSLSIALAQVSEAPISSCEELSKIPGNKYIYTESKFRAIQKLESKSDYCDSMAVVNDSIIHHQRDKIAIQAAFIHTDSLALASERSNSHALLTELEWTQEKRKEDRTLFVVIGTVLLIIGGIAISK